MRAQRAAMLGAAGHGEAGAGQGRRAVEDGDRRRACRQRATATGRSSATSRCASSAATGSASSAPNGAGKTTLLKLLTGELAPDSGTVTQAKTLSGHRHRPAAQADGAGASGCATCSPTAATGSRSAGTRSTSRAISRNSCSIRRCRRADRVAVGRRAVAAAAGARVRAAKRTCWCSTSRPTTSTSRRSTCCRK